MTKLLVKPLGQEAGHFTKYPFAANGLSTICNLANAYHNLTLFIKPRAELLYWPVGLIL